MSSMMRRLLRGFVLSAVVLSTQYVLSSPAFAASSCAGAGYLCIYDHATAQYGNFSGTNPSWAPYGWDARADWFRNDGRTYNVCVFQYHNYSGTRRTILRGKGWSYPNFGRSNLWTSRTAC